MVEALPRVVGLNNIDNEWVQALSLHKTLQARLTSLGTDVEGAEEHKNGDIEEKLVHADRYGSGLWLSSRSGVHLYL